MKTVDHLNWEITFGKYKHQTIKKAIENNPSSFSSGIEDIHGETQWQGINLLARDSFISYLKWAERENILTVLPEVWEEIEHYDYLFTKIQSYENGAKEITTDFYNECVKKFNELKDKKRKDEDYPSDHLDPETKVEPRYDWVKRLNDDVLEFQQLSWYEAAAGKGLTMEEHKKLGSHGGPPRKKK